jgi:hypothetical protein
MGLMDELPRQANVYSLFEPRTYGLPRRTYPDAIVSNFAHDVYLYHSAAEIIRHWKSEQYTHILVYERGRDFMEDFAPDKFPPATQQILEDTLSQLTPIGKTPDKIYSIYQIP